MGEALKFVSIGFFRPQGGCFFCCQNNNVKAIKILILMQYDTMQDGIFMCTEEERQLNLVYGKKKRKNEEAKNKNS